MPHSIMFQRFVAALAGDSAPPMGPQLRSRCVVGLNGDTTLLTEGRPEKEAIHMSDELHHPIYRRRLAASQYLRERFGFNCAVATLAKLASVGGGPKFVHAGRCPLYPESELDAWALSRISPLKVSTSDRGSVDLSAPIGKSIAIDAEAAEAMPAPGTGTGEERSNARLEPRRITDPDIAAMPLRTSQEAL